MPYISAEEVGTCKGKENDGYYPHLKICELYYRCVDGKQVSYRCPKGTIFDPYSEPAGCNHKNNVGMTRRTCQSHNTK